MIYLLNALSSSAQDILIVTFGIVLVGLLLGKVKVFGFSLGSAAVLIAAAWLGAFASGSPSLAAETVRNFLCGDNVKNGLNLLSTLGSLLFTAPIGISAGYALSLSLNKDKLKYALIGTLMADCAFGVCCLARVLISDFDLSDLLGILCGAMTTTPGLASAKEIAGVSAEQVVTSYGITYLFGVVGTVAFVQFIGKRKTKSSALRTPETTHTTVESGLSTLCVVILLGAAIGAIRMPMMDVALGNSGGVLISGIAVGVIRQKLGVKIGGVQASLNFCRQLGLVLFFVSSGVTSGMKLSPNIRLSYVGIGAAVTTSVICVGYILSAFMFKGERYKQICAVCGGMTATPAINLAAENASETLDMSGYSISYACSLITSVLAVKVIYGLFS